MTKIFLLFLMTLMMVPVFADEQTENTQLARVNSVLNSLYPLIDAAEKAAPKHRRKTFHYDWLRQDIQSVQAGIAAKVNKAPIEPRAVVPLRTQYVQLMDKTAEH